MNIRSISFRVLGVILAAVVANVSFAGERAPLAVVADQYVTPDGTLERGSAVTIEDTVISGIVPANTLAARGRVDRYPGAVMSPGLIDLRSTIGAYGNDDETAFAVDPSAEAVAVLNPTHRDFRAAVESGVTSVMIAPNSTNLVSGACVVIKTVLRDGSNVDTLRADGPLVFALGPGVLKRDRAPTSDIGALTMLRAALEDAQAGRGHPRLQQFVNGSMDSLVVCDRPMDVDAAVRTLTRPERRVTIVHTSDDLGLASVVTGTDASVVVGPYTFDMPSRTLRGAGVLAAAGVPVVIAGGTPRHSAESLRVSAALAVRHGMSPAAARRGITRTAAEVAGVSNRVGAIAPALDADLVVFSGDPLRLDSRVLAVYVGGVRVYSDHQHR